MNNFLLNNDYMINNFLLYIFKSLYSLHFKATYKFKLDFQKNNLFIKIESVSIEELKFFISLFSLFLLMSFNETLIFNVFIFLFKIQMNSLCFDYNLYII